MKIQSQIKYTMEQIKTILFLSIMSFVSTFCLAQETQQVSSINQREYNQLPNQDNTWLDVKGIAFSEIPDMEIRNGVTHKNLSLYLIVGNINSLHTKNLQTLDEALRSKSAIVAETGNVNQLSIKNISKTKDLFINAGDIVKGGKQDRTLTFDLWVPKNSETALASFCVEESRWRQRGDEDISSFNENKYVLSSRKLKIASQVKNSQGEVWQNVAKQQEDLTTNISADVKSEISASSLQLTLENDQLKEEMDLYEKAFSDFALENNAIGFAYAINGELYGTNIYASPTLFQKVRKKILMSVIVEAISEVADEVAEAPGSNAVKNTMNQIVKDNSTQYKINNGYNLSLKWSNDAGYIIESRIQEQTQNDNKAEVSDFSPDKWLHRGYIFISE